MGTFWSMISARIEHVTSRALEHCPIMYARSEDYTTAGLPRKRMRGIWGLTMKTMMTLDIPTRRFLFPVIKNRISRYKGSLKYSHANLKNLLSSFPKWDEHRLFDLHDLFQLFEVDGDGLIDISEMCVGFDNMGDTTPLRERLIDLRDADVDGTGAIDFEEFLQLLYNLEQKSDGTSSLAERFKLAESEVKFIRHMSVIQQVRAGLL